MNLVMDGDSHTKEVVSVQDPFHRRKRHSPLAANAYDRHRRLTRADGGVKGRAANAKQPCGFADREQQRKSGRAPRSLRRGETHCGAAVVS